LIAPCIIKDTILRISTPPPGRTFRGAGCSDEHKAGQSLYLVPDGRRWAGNFCLRLRRELSERIDFHRTVNLWNITNYMTLLRFHFTKIH